MTREIDIATAPRRTSKQWKNGRVTRDELLRWVANPADHKECGGYLLGKLTGPRRINKNVAHRSAIVVDVDKPDEIFLTQIDVAFPYDSIWHSTYSSTAEDRRYRGIIFTDRDMTPGEYPAAVKQVMEDLGAHQFDTTSAEVARFMYKPSASDPAEYEWLAIDGDPIAVDGLVQTADIPDHILKTKRDPFSLKGVAGTFNRAYPNLDELVEAYSLPYVHQGADRWLLAGASSVAGMGQVSDGLWYSHHANDPAHGYAQTAFDLVRIHRFGDLDAGATDKTPVNKLPSYVAMAKLAAEDPRVKASVLDDLDDISTPAATPPTGPAATPPDPNWRNKLSVNPSTGAFNDDVNNWNLIRRHDEVFRLLSLNEMTAGVEVTGDLPWRSKDDPSETFGRNDRTELRAHIERTCGFKPERMHLDDLVNATAARQAHHPIRDYLKSLEWDGVPRIETCLPGVKPTEYTRIVARRVLLAAVARVMDPGCKWDHMLVLYGKEGLGKTYWLQKMSKGFYASLGRIGDKDTLLSMQRSWIMIADEAHALKSTSFDAQKEFLTRTEDTFRRPYDVEAQTVKRHSIFVGTTNDKNLLTQQEGNRRFLPVTVEEQVDFEALTDEYIDQLWAEAVTAYQLGEQWHLTESETRLAAAAREDFTLDDPKVGMVEEYLDTAVPKSWPNKAPDERAFWFRMRGEDTMEPGVDRIDQVSAVQIMVEAFGRKAGEWREEDLRSVTDIMNRMPDWTEAPGKQEVPMYGQQKVWRRNTS